jgi:hypothetical protein
MVGGVQLSVGVFEQCRISRKELCVVHSHLLFVEVEEIVRVSDSSAFVLLLLFVGWYDVPFPPPRKKFGKSLFCMVITIEGEG